MTSEEFWPHYLELHANPANRALHLAGTATALGLLGAGIVKRKPSLALAGIAAGYGAAWAGHFLFEKNRPATFHDPARSLGADFRMLWLFATGRLGRELARRAAPQPAGLSPEKKRSNSMGSGSTTLWERSLAKPPMVAK